jgi:hypothetical protein
MLLFAFSGTQVHDRFPVHSLHPTSCQYVPVTMGVIFRARVREAMSHMRSVGIKVFILQCTGKIKSIDIAYCFIVVVNKYILQLHCDLLCAVVIVVVTIMQ